MGGREAVRGFSVQTFVVLLDALRDENADWIAVTVEPDSDNDKVDILWEFETYRRGQQVKSSKNQITRGDAVKWSADLKASKGADEYQLILSGPVAQAVIDDQPFNGVAVPLPLSLDTLALIEQGCSKIDVYLEKRGITRLPHSIREAIVNLVSARVTDGAIYGRRFTRVEFDGWLLQLVTAAYPEAIAHTLTANCEVIWNELFFTRQERMVDESFRLDLPLTVVNGGPAVSILEWFIVKVASDQYQMRYEPKFYEEGERKVGFGQIAILPNSWRDIVITFLPKKASGFYDGRWDTGIHKFSLWAKFRSIEEPRLVRQVEIEITGQHLQSLTGNPKVQNISSIDFD
ncbi:hypothetical protein ACQZ4X_04695 [Agrobacterium vitis]